MAVKSLFKVCLNVTAKSLPSIGLGTWATEDLESMQQSLEVAVDAGYKMIDTAFMYNNEKFIGESLKNLYSKNKIRREDLYITSKLPMTGLRADSVEHFLKLSLDDLQTDYLDLYLIHFPVGIKRGENDYEVFPKDFTTVVVDEEVNLLETWKVMESMVDKGLVKSIGLSNFNSRQIKMIYDSARIKPVNLQVECHAYLTQTKLFEFCKNLNISFTAYAPLGTPGLPDYIKKHTGYTYKTEKLLEDPKVLEVSSKYGKTPAQILLRYLVQRGMTVVPKSINPGRIRENIQIFDFELKGEDMDVLNSLNKNLRYFKSDLNESLVKHPEYPYNEEF